MSAVHRTGGAAQVVRGKTYAMRATLIDVNVGTKPAKVAGRVKQFGDEERVRHARDVGESWTRPGGERSG